MEQSDFQMVIGLAFLGLIIISLCAYYTWNVYKRRLPMRRMAEEDLKEIENNPEKRKEVTRHALPPLISANSALAGITFAALIIVIALILVEKRLLLGEATAMEKLILFTGLTFAGISTICFLFSIDQLTQMLAPSVDSERWGKFYRFSFNLWVIAELFIVASLLLFILLANAYVAMLVGLVTLFVMMRYWKIHSGW